MYICLGCGLVFDDRIRIVEPHGEEYWGCPSCRGYTVEAEYCDWCGEAYAKELLEYVAGNAHDLVCIACREEENALEDC